ncbi:MAG: hypothetical protein V4719_08315 [Planctomycetota bacterium]
MIESESSSSRKLTVIIYLLAANVVVVAITAGVVGIGLLSKLERAVKATERIEARFHDFADAVQPVVSAGAGKAVEAIKKMDADKLSATATEKTNSLINSAAEKAKRFLDKDKNKAE